MKAVPSQSPASPRAPHAKRSLLRAVALAAVILVLWALLRRAPLGNVHLGGTAWRVANSLAARPAGPFLAIAVIALAGTFFVPITFLEATALAVFGAWPGIPVAWAGAVLAATASHAAGTRWGTGIVRWLPEKLGRSLQGLLRGRPFWSVVLMRLLPVGNFGLLNLFAGALEIPWRPFLLGNVVGIAPGLLGLGVLVNRALAVLRHPSVTNAILAGAVALAATAVAVTLRRAARRPNS
jgi:uncharacterized membrane protein YdjX (TVP38/TMEM64 family)